MEPLPAQLLNNAAVLSMRGGEPHAALALIEEAVQVSAASPHPCLERHRLTRVPETQRSETVTQPGSLDGGLCLSVVACLS